MFIMVPSSAWELIVDCFGPSLLNYESAAFSLLFEGEDHMESSNISVDNCGMIFVLTIPYSTRYTKTLAF